MPDNSLRPVSGHPLFEKKRIFAPGPTPVPEEVLSVLSQAPLHHRTKEFSALLARVRTRLQLLFETKEPVYVFAASGTGAMEATVANLFVPGDEVITINGGKFGERWGKIASKFGLTVHVLEVPWGSAAQPEDVKKALAEHPNTRAVLFQASETSTGVAHPAKEIAEAVREASDALVVVDGITAVGVSELPMDKWGLDAVVSGSQKAMMLPPGLAFLSLSKKAQALRKRGGCPRFYFDLDAEDKAFGKDTTAWTPSVSLICALDPILEEVEKSGMAAIHKYFAKLAQATRTGAAAMGLELFAKKNPSQSVTAIHVPEGIDGKKLVATLRDHFGLTLAGGQDAWAGKIFRIGHLGFYDELDILTVLSASEMALRKLGYECTPGAGAGAAASYLLESE